MDFTFDEDLAAVRDLATQIFTDRAEASHVRTVESAGGFDDALWKVLADAGLLGIAVPEEAGGAGMGMLGLLAVLEQQGRRVAPLPLWAVAGTAMLPIARFGSAEQRERWLPGLLDGSLLVTGAFETPDGGGAAVRADPADQGWHLWGEVPSVPAGQHAAAFVVPVPLPDRPGAVAVVPADRTGVSAVPVAATNHGAHATLRLDRAHITAADLLDDHDHDVAAWGRRRARVALAALSLGVCEEAVRMTAEYTSQRIQFGRPVSTNQGVVIRAVDAHIDTEAIRLTAQRAAWLLDNGQEQAAESAALVAKLWASRGGLRVVHATQHLHGGIGADVDYPIHRYFLWGRQIAFSLGSAAATEALLGDALIDAPAIGAAD